VVALAGLTFLSLPTGRSAAAASASPPSATSPYVHGLLSSPQGGFLYDQYGRVVIMHGVNAVYKRPPYELFVDPGKPWNFTSKDASAIAGLGFNIVRLGIIWAGIEPGTLKTNDPAICTPGKPSDPHQWNQGVANRYLAKVQQTVDVLARYHVYTLLDMHEDVYSTGFHGEGAPAWAVCTNGLPIKTLPGRWSNNYASPSLNAAVRNFWKNDVVGDIQGEYDRAWAAVATVFKNDPWVVGYDPINEPFTTTLDNIGPEALDARLECFYTGSAMPGRLVDSTKTLTCPSNVPAQGLIPTIRAVDPNHLIFREPTIFASGGAPNYVGPMNYSNLVLNFHDYCSYRSGVTGNPTNLAACVAQEESTFIRRSTEGPLIATPSQPLGLPLFMSEFGATQSSALLQNLTRVADQSLIGWSYWSWKYYDDPTGSSAEALASPTGQLHPIASALSQPYPQAVAGSLTLIDYDAASRAFYLNFLSNPKVKAPTLISVPTQKYPKGYCARSSAGQVHKVSGAVEVTNPPTIKTVEVTVTPGQCP
jgi:endoglycosylceramidase